MGLFGKLFDLNNDGELDALEQATEFAAFSSMMDSMEDQDKDEDLEAVGLDRYDLINMDDDERREALEEVGLDPDDYDYE